MNLPGPSDVDESRSGVGELGLNLAGTLRSFACIVLYSADKAESV